MWRLFKELGTYGAVYGNTFDPGVDASKIDLDTITKNRVALKALRLAVEKQTRLVFLLLAFHVLLDDGATQVWLDDDASHLQDGTASKYWPHVYFLLEVGLVVRPPKGCREVFRGPEVSRTPCGRSSHLERP